MKLVFATGNQNKVKEVQELLPKYIELLSLKDIGCTEDIPETQTTIEGNAIQKANYVKQHYNYNCFADDTGLEVTALGGEPGVLSARYAGEQKNAEDNMYKLLSNLKENSNRKAHFKTSIALVIDNKELIFNGICEGEITTKKTGSNGFGYDPIFKPNGFEETFAEMNIENKNKISHRGKAIQQLIIYLNTLNY